MTDYRPELLAGVEAFHHAADIPIAAAPGFPDHSTRLLRRRLLSEEYYEYMEAEESDDLIEVVDALLDIIVVSWGALLTYIGPAAAHAAAAEVTRSNLAKIVDGVVLRRPDGKVIKPAGWTPPDIAAALTLKNAET